MTPTMAAEAIPASVRRVRRVALPIVFLALVLGLIELSFRVDPGSSPGAAPSLIVETLFASLPLLAEHARQTAVEASIGFALGALLGMTIAMLMSIWKPLARALYPNLVAFQLIPKIALAPLFTLWLGVGAPSRVVFTVFLCFFPVMVATTAGVAGAPSYAIKLARSLNASQWQTFAQVRAPFAIPFIVAGLKVSATLAMIGIVVGEFVTAQAGLGYIVLFASSAGETRLLFSALILLCVEGLALYATVVALGWLLQLWYGARFEAVQAL